MNNEIIQVTEQKQEIAVLQDQMDVNDIIGQVNLIHNIMSKVMKKDEHYGVIPGCKKPSLYQAGAQKLAFAFRLSASYEIHVQKLDNEHREYEVISTIKHIRTGQIFGQGVGNCSTLETKYKNKKPADCYNTVLKMAKKRAYVDGITSVTAASDIFTQDVEDMIDNGINLQDKDEVKVFTKSNTEEKPSQKQIDYLKKLMQQVPKEKVLEIAKENGLPESFSDYNKHQTCILIDKLKLISEINN